MEFSHIPVLLQPCLDGLNIDPAGIYLDGTAGGAGHSREIAKRLTTGRLISLDQDPDAVAVATERLKGLPAQVVQVNFREAARVLAELGIPAVNGALLDLGVSSHQLDDAARGFSYHADAPLDMRMDQSQDTSAATIVNHYSEKELSQIIRHYGEEPPTRAHRIARAIVIKRSKQPIVTTTELADLIAETLPRRGKIHPATRTFQALRIETNDELGQIERTLPLLIKLLAPGGRLAVISFHSLEDRLVKNFLREQINSGLEADLTVLTKHPIAGTDDVYNPRARSAKLRAAAKINN
jgi:16S rRNA (cytosine1402-N4)-methyltransferase